MKTDYPKRLIEVDLPIKKISAHARREKSIRHGHISTLHIWWARRPLAACRAVICAALWPDPVDEHCPQPFREAVAQELTWFAEQALKDRALAEKCDPETFKFWQRIARKDARLKTGDFNECMNLRHLLLAFIADFANWDNSTRSEYLAVSRKLTQAAHEALGGIPGTKPLVVDPFAGGGAIPLEALRVGADAFASDLNPVAVLLNKVVLEYIPKHGQHLADEVRRWGQWVKEQAEKELAEFYPKDPDGATPIAYLWARTITCEGPDCGAEVPLIRSLWLAKKGNRSVALRLVPNHQAKHVEFDIIEKAKDVDEGTVRRGSATCPVCGFTTPVASVRQQLKARRGGAADARLICVVTARPGQQGRFYRLPTAKDTETTKSAAKELERRANEHAQPLTLIPDEALDVRGIRHTWAMIYGLETWKDLFAPRQALALSTLTRLVRDVPEGDLGGEDQGLGNAVRTCLALGVTRLADRCSSLCRWDPTPAASGIINTFSRQALPMMWDFAEGSPFEQKSGGWLPSLEWIALVAVHERCIDSEGIARIASATVQPLPDDAADALITDPPYYDAVPYAYLSDFFYVWLRRMLADSQPDLNAGSHVPKDDEIVVDRPHELSTSTKDVAFYERELTKAFADGRRVLRPEGIGTIVFASKTTASWEAILQAVVDAGWTITGSWPIDTEMEARVAAQGQARLASSVHLVCRPREHPDGELRSSEVGDWRDVLAELPQRIHEWMPRLAREGVVGADAIFACLGPALEVFSRYARVEKASGEEVPLREYLEHVWAAVSREALSMIFAGADATGFEPDARLTAMWLWTLSTGGDGGAAEDEREEDEEGEGSGKNGKASGFALEYDAARKIAQGLGAHLERLPTVVEVKGDKARLLAVRERTRYLFGKDGGPPGDGVKKRDTQLNLFGGKEEQAQAGVSGLQLDERPSFATGTTVLDRVHQAMLLFGSGRGEAMRRFLVEEGAGNDQRFWRLAQALSALYPPQSDEKRWVDGVLARKKGLGF